MNMILLHKSDFIDNDTVLITDRRLKHMNEVHKISQGKDMDVGLLNGKTGTGEVMEFNRDSVKLRVKLDSEPPAPTPMTAVIALPRPKAVKRLIQSATTLGIKEIYLINSWKVEKSYWQSPVLNEESLNLQLELGLEQCKDTVKPNIYLKKLFKPFIEDELPGISKGSTSIIAHPYSDSEIMPIIEEENHILPKITLAIGPEGGFTDYEIGKFTEAGFSQFSFGTRILKVETALNFLTGRFYQNI